MMMYRQHRLVRSLGLALTRRRFLSSFSSNHLSIFQSAILPKSVGEGEGVGDGRGRLDLDVVMKLCRNAVAEFIAIATQPDQDSANIHRTRLHGAFLLLFDMINAEALRLAPDELGQSSSGSPQQISATLSPKLLALLSVSKEASKLSLSLGFAPDARSSERLVRLAGLESVASARRAFNEIGFGGSAPTRDAFYALLEACARHNSPSDALPILLSMTSQGLRQESTVLSTLLSTLLTQADSILEIADKDASGGDMKSKLNLEKIQSCRLLQAVAISIAEDELKEALSEMELSQLEQSTLQSEHQLQSDERSDDMSIATTPQGQGSDDSDLNGSTLNVNEEIVEEEKEEEAIPVQLEKDAEKWSKAVKNILNTSGGESNMSAEALRDLVLKSRMSSESSSSIQDSVVVSSQSRVDQSIEEENASSSSSSSSSSSASSSTTTVEQGWSDVIDWRSQAKSHEQEIRERTLQRFNSFLLMTEEALSRNYEQNEKGVDPRLKYASDKCKSNQSIKEEILDAVKGRLRFALGHVIPSRVNLANSSQDLVVMESDAGSRIDTEASVAPVSSKGSGEASAAPLSSKGSGVLSPLQRSQLVASLVNYCLAEEKRRRIEESNKRVQLN